MKIAVIGTGLMAMIHLEILTQEPGIEVVGHVNPHTKGTEAAVRRWGGRGYTSTRELLEHEQVDAAWITVPPGGHGQTERELINRDIPFFVEKPLSADRRTAEEIGETLEKKGLIAGVGYHWRAMDTIPLVRQKLAENPARMVLASWHDRTPTPAWWQRQETSGGQMVEQATHLVDITRFLVGEAQVACASSARTPRTAYPDMNIAETCAAILRFSGGAQGIFTSTCLLGGPSDIRVQFVCDGMLITLTQTDVTFDHGNKKEVVRTGNNPFRTENHAFLQALVHQDASRLYSSYADALKTHTLTQDVLEKSL